MVLEAGAVEEFFEDEPSEAARIVADDTVDLEKVVEDDAVAKFLHLREVDGDGRSALAAVALGNIGGDRLAVRNHPIDDAATGVTFDGTKMVRERVIRGFAGLGHEIGDVHTRRFGFRNGGGDFRDEQIGKNAGVKRARAKKNQIGLPNGFDRFRKGPHGTRKQRDFPDAPAGGGDAGFAVNLAAIFHGGDERNQRNRRRKNPAADGQDLAADANGFGEITGHVGEGSEEQVAKIVADEAAAGVETILKEVAEKGFVLGKSDHAVANIAGGKDAVLAAQATGAAAVVGDGNDGSQVTDGVKPFGIFTTAADKFFQTAEEGGKPGAAAKSYNIESAGSVIRIGFAF